MLKDLRKIWRNGDWVEKTCVAIIGAGLAYIVPVYTVAVVWLVLSLLQVVEPW